MELSTLIAQNLEDTPSKLVDLQLFLDNINSGSGLGGTNYVFVRGDGTPEENAAELQAAYDAAKTKPRYLGSLDLETEYTLYQGQTFKDESIEIFYLVTETFTGAVISNMSKVSEITQGEAQEVFTEMTVVVAPGEYTFTTPFTVDTPHINIVSLTGNSDVILNGINVIANNIYLKGINCGTYTFAVDSGLNELICENCIGGNDSFCGGADASGTFINCRGGVTSFGGGVGGIASGVFENCIGAGASFGGSGGTASGIFNYCEGGEYSFGSMGTASGTFINCTGGDSSFGGEYGGIIASTARLYYCRLKEGPFNTPELGGKLVLCIDGDNSVVTTA